MTIVDRRIKTALDPSMAKMTRYIWHIIFVVIVSSGCNNFPPGQESEKNTITQQDTTGNITVEEKLAYYEFKTFPLKYAQPDIEAWIGQLKPLNEPPKKEKHVTVAFRKDKAVYIELSVDTLDSRKEKYSIMNDTIRLDVEGRVAAASYSLYIYKEGRLHEYMLSMACGDRDTTYFCPYRKEVYEYWPGTKQPRYLNTFYINKLARFEEDMRVEFDRFGNRVGMTKSD